MGSAREVARGKGGAVNDWQLLKFRREDKTGRVYRVEQRVLPDGTVETREVLERRCG